MKNPLSSEVYLSRKVPRVTDIRGDYFRDQTAIIHSMPFRRLKNKTQVFFAPRNDHVCTRIEHVMHVSTIATTICKGLKRAGWELDEELAGAIGLGHDLGHAPFGHAGEEAISNKLGYKDAFIHEVNSYRVVEYLANSGSGLNLTYAVKDGIICHNGEKYEQYITPRNNAVDLDSIKHRTYYPSSFEGCIVRISDKVAYLGRDIEDAIVAQFINSSDIPEKIQVLLGNNNGNIINSLVIDIIDHSSYMGKIGFSEEKFEVVSMLKDFNYSKIYGHPRILEYKRMCQQGITHLFEYLSKLYCKCGKDYTKYYESKIHLDNAFGRYLCKMEGFYLKEENIPNTIITDYIGGMTDIYALECLNQITIPKPIEFL